MSNIQRVRQVEALEAAIKAHPATPQDPSTLCPTKHYFADGVAGREITIPKGVVLVGRIHNHAQINVISKGEISVMTANGLVRMKAPCTIVSPAGVKRAGYAHEETVWTTFLATELTDPDEIEDTLTSATYEEFWLAQQRRLEGEK